MMENRLAPYENQFDNHQRKMFIAEMLREFRKTMGYQQKEVAEVIGISPQTYNGYEKGRNEPPAEILVRLSYFYGVSVDMLVQRDTLDVNRVISVAKMEAEFERIAAEFKNSPNANNEQLNQILEAMKGLTEIAKNAAEKHENK